jgi:hypothetical protein
MEKKLITPLGKYVYSMQYAANHGVSMYVIYICITREYMEHGGRIPANSTLTVYYLPVYSPYSDYNYGLSSFTGTHAIVGVAVP